MGRYLEFVESLRPVCRIIDHDGFTLREACFFCLGRRGCLWTVKSLTFKIWMQWWFCGRCNSIISLRNRYFWRKEGITHRYYSVMTVFDLAPAGSLSTKSNMPRDLFWTPWPSYF
jgi:hypothetical protein